MSAAQALAILRRLVPVHLIGMDVVEVSPPYDHSEITALAAAQIATEFLCLLGAKAGPDSAIQGHALARAP